MSLYPIAVELLEAERERLLRDHFETPPQGGIAQRAALGCDGCKRAIRVRAELASLKAEA